MKHKCFGIFLIVLLAPLFFIAFTLLNLKMTILNLDFLKKELEKASFYTLVEQYAPQFFEKSIPEQSQGSKELIIAIQESITADWAKTQIEQNLENFSNWFYGQTPNLKIAISNQMIKDNFLRQMEKTYNNLPVCGWQNQQQEVFNFSCKMPGVSVETFKKQIAQEFEKPENKIFSGYSFEGNPLANFPLLSAKPGVALNWILYLSSGLSLLFLIIIGIMARESWHAFFRWLGIALAIPSSLLFFLSIISKFLTGMNFSASSFFPVSEGLNVALKIIEPLSKTINSDLANKNLLFSSLLFGFSIILIVISFLFKKPEEQLQIPKT